MRLRLYPMWGMYRLMVMLGVVAVIVASYPALAIGAEEDAPTGDGDQAALRTIVSKYLDQQLKDLKVGDSSPDLPEGTQERYGRATILLEQIRQAQQRDSDVLLGAILRRWHFGTEFFPDHKDALIPVLCQGLTSSTPLYRLKAAGWVAFNQQWFEEADITAARKVCLEAFVASQGEGGFDTLLKLGTKAEIPAIRRVYEQHYRAQQALDYRCHAILWFHLPRRLPAHVLFLLVELGDPKALQEIRAAIVQEKDVQQRAWGLFMAMQLKTQSLLPLAIQMLDDKRVVPEEIDEWGDPDAKSPQQRYLASVRTRMCDVAARALYAIADKPKDWPVKEMPVLGGWRLDHGYSLQIFKHKEPGDKGWQADRTAVVRQWVAGFTDEELAVMKQYAQNSKPPKGQKPGHEAGSAGE